MKKILLLLVLTPFLMCSSCDTSDVTGKADKVKNNANLRITCNVSLPTSAELGSSYSWIDDVTLVHDSDNLSNVWVYYADIDGTNDPVLNKEPFDATFIVRSLSEDKRSGIVEIGVTSPLLIGETGKYFYIEFIKIVNEAKRPIANLEEYIKYDKKIKAGDIIMLDATADYIYTNTDLDLPVN